MKQAANSPTVTLHASFIAESLQIEHVIGLNPMLGGSALQCTVALGLLVLMVHSHREDEPPAGTKEMDGVSIRVYTSEQQSRLAVDEQGKPTRSFKPVYSNEEPRLLQLERTLHIHRLTPKRANPNGPCSTLLERIPPDTPISEVLSTVSRRMGFEASALWMDAAEGAPRVRVGALDQLRSETLYVSEHTSARDALKLDL